MTCQPLYTCLTGKQTQFASLRASWKVFPWKSFVTRQITTAPYLSIRNDVAGYSGMFHGDINPSPPSNSVSSRHLYPPPCLESVNQTCSLSLLTILRHVSLGRPLRRLPSGADVSATDMFSHNNSLTSSS